MISKREFQFPPKDFREVPFWSWNDALKERELYRQIGLIATSGWGGFFMHARIGLRTPYLSADWFHAVKVSLQAAREHGLSAWLYDEDKWPSGYAGGIVTAPKPEYRTQYIVCKVDHRPVLIDERLALFQATEENGQLHEIHAVAQPEFTSSKDRILQFFSQVMPLGNPLYGGYAYLDVLNPEAVNAFLDSTHEKYWEEFSEYFGNTIPGIFTDDACYDDPTYIFLGCERPWQSQLPWTGTLPDYFYQRRGYDIIPHLPALFFELEESPKIRHDFWLTITERFVQSYTRQINRWCTEHGLLFTGHYMGEDSLLSQVRWIGAAMPHYAEMHIPGVDKLGRQINAGLGTVLTIKQLDSVVCQLGKPRALCENFACTGQDFSFFGRKWLGDWAYILGVNFQIPHLSLYSLRGKRKRDYPPNLYYQQPWWPENRVVADYFARLSYLLSQGKRKVDIIMIHPIRSAWMKYSPNSAHAVMDLNDQLDEITLNLLNNHHDFHFADESLIAPGNPAEGRVETTSTGPRLKIGEMSYELVLLPPCSTLASSTIDLLKEFVTAGGKVLAIAPYPERIDGKQVDRRCLPQSIMLTTREDFLTALDQLILPDVQIPGGSSIWIHHRQMGQDHIYFLANLDIEKGLHAPVSFAEVGLVEEWDLLSGTSCPLSSHESNQRTHIELEFPPGGSHLLVIHSDQDPQQGSCSQASMKEYDPIVGPWVLSVEGHNVLLLDHAEFKLGSNQNWSLSEYVLDIQNTLMNHGIGTPFSVRYTFCVESMPTGPLYLVLESPENYCIFVNDRPVREVCDWWTDISFRKIDISGLLVNGKNTIQLEAVFSESIELENTFILGDFSVEGQLIGTENQFNGQRFDRYQGPFLIKGNLPRTVEPRTGSSRIQLDLTQLGFPFFAGRVKFQKYIPITLAGDRAFLEIDGISASLGNISVNGNFSGTLTWPPYRIEITKWLRPGDNLLEVELASSLRNLLGPHHLLGGDQSWIGPAEFNDKSRWTDGYVLVPFGFNQIKMIWERFS